MKDIIQSFPGYEFKIDPISRKKSNFYRGTNLGFGGYVYTKEGCYTNVALIDVQSLHPSSIIAMNYFGEYTKRYQDILQTRLYIKHGDYDSARKMFDGKIAKYLDDENTAKALSDALKIALNSCYGLTSAGFLNAFRDSRNENNTVALRGALFMRTLQDEVKARGFEIVHIKTDSAKIPNATMEIVQFCMDFAEKYGYSFELEAIYDRMCLVDKANYIAKYATISQCERLYGYIPGKNKKNGGKWTATGAYFQQPFIYKTMFTKEPIEFSDLCEVKSVQGAKIYLDINEGLPDVSIYDEEIKQRLKPDDSNTKVLNPSLAMYSDDELEKLSEPGHNYEFIGKVGQFTPVVEGVGGGGLVAKRDSKYSSVNGAKGYRWMESVMVKQAGLEDKIDLSYYRNMVDKAIARINQYCDFEWFVSDDPLPQDSQYPPDDHEVPWLMPCKDPSKNVCEDCEDKQGCPHYQAEQQAQEERAVFARR